MEFKKIGLIHSIYEKKKDAPRQGGLSREESTIEVFPEYIKALVRLEGLFS